MKTETERIVFARANEDTEPIIRYDGGTIHSGCTFGALALHTINETSGVQQIIAPETSIFLIGSGVTVTDVWQGMRQLQTTYSAGDVQLLPAGTEVRSNYVSNAYSETMVRIPESIIEDACSDLAPRSLAMIYQFHSFRQRQTLGLTSLITNMMRADVINVFEPILGGCIAQAMAASVAYMIAGKHPEEGKNASLSQQRLGRALDFIEANLHRPLSLHMIADKAALNQHHFARAFKAATGITPMRYVLQRRVERAKRMLLDRNASIAEVALSCGFTAQPHFTTAFKLATGMTPAAWRKAA